LSVSSTRAQKIWITISCGIRPRRLPERGHIGIFNRSYYEEVLIVRVHKDVLKAERLPEGFADEKMIWRDRFRSIINLENI